MGKGREIQEIPMCGNCVISCEIDSLDRNAVAQKALRRVDRVDGGLSRKRWERQGHGTVSRKATGAIKRVPGKISRAVEGLSTHHQQPQVPSHGHSYHSRLTGDGTLSVQAESDESSLHCVVPLDSTIYVSIFDPIDEPAFRPSPTKPIPRWMQMLPGQRSQYRRQQPRPHSILDVHFRPPSMISIKTPPSSSAPRTLCPTAPAPIPAPISTPPPPQRRSPLRRRKSRESMSSHYSEQETPQGSQVQFTTFKGPSFVADEPLKRPFSRVTAPPPQTRLDDDNEESGRTSPAPESLSLSLSPFAKQHLRSTPPPDSRSKSPPGSNSSSNSNSNSHNYTHNHHARQPSPLVATTAAAAARDEPTGTTTIAAATSSPHPPSPLAEQVAAHLQRYRRRHHHHRTPPAQSTEFLSLYGRAPTGVGTNAASAAVPGRGRGRVAGEGRRRVRELVGTGRISTRTKTRMGTGTGTGTASPGGGYGMVADEQGRKRSSLQAELKRLFGGSGGGA
ncbi:hypothetical protein F5X99DRAFT_407775 [Biscogniauxia marginata]|nr:hypothetical protein F5X99DRAFT_407775 [Biscogniauxia marginata]